MYSVIEEFVSAAGYSHALALYMKYAILFLSYFTQSNEPGVF